MKKINYRKLANVLLWFFAIAGLFVSWSFVSKKQKDTKVNSVQIDILNPSDHDYIDNQEVFASLNSGNHSILHETIKNIDIHTLEKRLNAHPCIENAEVTFDINGDVKVKVKQRRPMIRIINADGESYYIDSLSKLMPLSDKTTSRVLIASGNINEPYSRFSEFSIDQISQNKKLSEVSLLDDIYLITQFIYKDSLLNHLIHQIYVDDNREFILVPIAGPDNIVLGEADELDQKFQKLKLFYTEGLNKTDSWRKYSTLNLKFKNLVVCTKK